MLDSDLYDALENRHRVFGNELLEGHQEGSLYGNRPLDGIPSTTWSDSIHNLVNRTTLRVRRASCYSEQQDPEQ